jgi:hypothetical protein
MFHIMRWRARSAKGRPNCTRPALEELETRDVPAAHAAPLGLALGATAPTAAVATQATTNGNTNGAAGQMPSFYEGTQVTVNMKELPKNASASTIANNKSINIIYAYADLDEEQPFKPVINAIQGEGFNPLWQQVLIRFNAGFTPHQFTSEADVLAAAKAGEITLVTTDEVYRCSVVGGSGRNA